MWIAIKLVFFAAVLIGGAVVTYYVDKALGVDMKQLGVADNVNIAHKVMWMASGSLISVLVYRLFIE